MSDYPRIYVIFRKYCVFPSTQNRDERIFSLVSLNTQARSRRIQVDTIEKKDALEARSDPTASSSTTKEDVTQVQMMMIETRVPLSHAIVCRTKTRVYVCFCDR